MTGAAIAFVVLWLRRCYAPTLISARFAQGGAPQIEGGRCNPYGGLIRFTTAFRNGLDVRGNESALRAMVPPKCEGE
jgi:hypothetical protein